MTPAIADSEIWSMIKGDTDIAYFVHHGSPPVKLYRERGAVQKFSRIIEGMLLANPKTIYSKRLREANAYLKCTLSIEQQPCERLNSQSRFLNE